VQDIDYCSTLEQLQLANETLQTENKRLLSEMDELRTQVNIMGNVHGYWIGFDVCHLVCLFVVHICASAVCFNWTVQYSIG